MFKSFACMCKRRLGGVDDDVERTVLICEGTLPLWFLRYPKWRFRHQRKKGRTVTRLPAVIPRQASTLDQIEIWAVASVQKNMSSVCVASPSLERHWTYTKSPGSCTGANREYERLLQHSRLNDSVSIVMFWKGHSQNIHATHTQNADQCSLGTFAHL